MRHYGDVIPSRVIILATLVICTTITWRTYVSWHEAEAQYHKIDTDVISVLKTTAELKMEARWLRERHPRVIEEAARARLNMVRPNEIVVPIDDSPARHPHHRSRVKIPNVKVQPPDDSPEQQRPATESKATTDNRLLLSYIVLALYCVTALIAGFVVVKSFIALSQYIAGRGGFRRSHLRLPRTNYIANHESALNTPFRLALLFFCGLVIASGFTFSAGKYSDVISYRDKSENLRRMRARLLEEQQQLIWQINAATAPAALDRAAREIGMKPAKSSNLARKRGMKPATTLLEDGSVIKKPDPVETLGSISKREPNESDSSSSITISPQTLKTILIILALLGGFLAIMFSFTSGDSELLTKDRFHPNRIDRAPGSNYLLIVDFLFSPKVVEETFKPIVTDWRTEYFEALQQKRVWKARWISVRYNYSFIASIGLCKAFSFIKLFMKVGR